MSAVEEAAKEFPPVFKLRGHAGRFTINLRQSYEAPFLSGNVTLYVFTEGGEAFCKGSPAELRHQVVPCA